MKFDFNIERFFNYKIQTMRTLFKYAGYNLTPIDETMMEEKNNSSIKQSENLKTEEIQVSKFQIDLQQKI